MSEQGKHTVVNREGFVISTDPARLDLEVIAGFLASSYWARDRSRETLERAVKHSLCFGVYAPDGRQVGFARVITDYATFGYLADVFIVESHRGQGLATWLVKSILAHPELATLRRWSLATRDAHAFYRQIGFTELRRPERYMEMFLPEDRGMPLLRQFNRATAAIRRLLDRPTWSR